MSRDFNDLTTRIHFHGMQPNEGPEAGEESSGILYECWAGVDTVWAKDYEQAKANNTLEDLTVFIRDPQRSFVPNNKHSISIKHPLYVDKLYNVKAVQPDLKDRRFITVIAGLVT